MAQASPEWPELKYETWADTLDTLQLVTQIVGKLKLSHMPWVNHAWNSALLLGARGFTTSGVSDSERKFEASFDFVDHTLTISTSDGRKEVLALVSEPVADFWFRFTNSLRVLGIGINFDPRPNERPDSIPFSEDRSHCKYDRRSVEHFWAALIRIDNLFQEFRSDFIGKSSPVHFFWGSFDLALARYSGKRAPEHPGGIPHLSDLVAKDAASHEEISFGFWPGNTVYPKAAFYCYAYPAPETFSSVDLGVQGAFYHHDLNEFIFPYEEALKAPSPENAILTFLQSAYESAAKLCGWNRTELEESPYLRQLQTRFGHVPLRMRGLGTRSPISAH